MPNAHHSGCRMKVALLLLHNEREKPRFKDAEGLGPLCQHLINPFSYITHSVTSHSSSHK